MKFPARNFDPVSAEAMLRTHLHWRKGRKMDIILQEDWSDIAKDFHATIDTYDRQGRPSMGLTTYVFMSGNSFHTPY